MPNIRNTVIALHLASLEFKTSDDAYVHLKPLEKVKGGSIALGVLYKLCTSSYGVKIDQWVVSLLKKYKIDVVKKDGWWSLEEAKIIKVCLLQKKDFVIVVRPALRFT